MTDPAENLRRAREYLAAIEAGARGDALRAFYALDVVQVEFPNRLTPKGATRRIEDILAAAERGREVLSTLHFEERNAVAEGDRVALEQRNYDCFEPW
jgi:ketosteroid isomerase-like protein